MKVFWLLRAAIVSRGLTDSATRSGGGEGIGSETEENKGTKSGNFSPRTFVVRHCTEMLLRCVKRRPTDKLNSHNPDTAAT